VKRSKRARRRYLLLTSMTELSASDQKEAVRLILQRYPDLDSRKMVWIGSSLILRTDHVRLPEMKLSLIVRSGSFSLVPEKASGSISKLKRAAELR
jgi:hypothetical protein